MAVDFLANAKKKAACIKFFRIKKGADTLFCGLRKKYKNLTVFILRFDN